MSVAFHPDNFHVSRHQALAARPLSMIAHLKDSEVHMYLNRLVAAQKEATHEILIPYSTLNQSAP